VRLVNLELYYFVWMGRVKNEVVKDEELNFLNMFIFNDG
jgi:hypothetical protein